jgi:hypothetical protein
MTGTEVCSGCGLAIAGGTAACRALFDELIARDFSHVLYGRHHRLMVDAYAVQHPDEFCRSARSLVAHLGGLCCALEFSSQPRVLEALRRWIERDEVTEKPPLPTARGAVTIADARAAGDPMAYGEVVQRWARSAWDAYAPLQSVARSWVTQALEASPRR